jgi:microcystin-dependent protein
MSEPFIAEIRIFAGNFAPRNWAFCNGQLLPIAQNTALFSLVGTTYGGDGRTTFGLPNLQGRAPMHPGNGPGLTSRRLGETGGASTHTLVVQEMPSHSHALKCAADPADSGDPADSLLAESSPLKDQQFSTGDQTAPMHSGNIGATGGGQPHNNLPPYLAMNFIIALVGLYPSRS